MHLLPGMLGSHVSEGMVLNRGILGSEARNDVTFASEYPHRDLIFQKGSGLGGGHSKGTLSLSIVEEQ